MNIDFHRNGWSLGRNTQTLPSEAPDKGTMTKIPTIKDRPLAPQTTENAGPESHAAHESFWREAAPEVRDVFAHVKQAPAGEHFFADMRQEVPVVPRGDATLIFLDPRALEACGVTLGRYGRVENEPALLNSFAVRPARDGEAATHTMTATRYHDPLRGSAEGAVQGDGRAGSLGPPVAVSHGPKTQTLLQLRVKGVATGLAPIGVPKGDGHGTGVLSESNAHCDSLLSAYFNSNGIKANRALAVASTNEPYDFFFVLGGEKIRLHSHVAMQLLGGSFDRLAHLKFVSDDPARVRSLLDDVAMQVAKERGLSKPPSHTALFKTLVQSRAWQLADTYWARALHGSTTYDNIGLRETIDIATAATVDRTHQTYRPVSHISPGFGGEAAQVLGDYYSGELFDLFCASASDDERKQLNALDPGRIGYGAYTERMCANALEQAGFDLDQIKRMLRHHRDAAYGLYAAVTDASAEVATGATYTMGDDTVADPAQYNVFTMLGSLVAIATSGKSDREQLNAITDALQPVQRNAARDDRIAKALLVNARAVVDVMLSGSGDRARLLGNTVSEARRINEPVLGFSSGRLRAWSTERLADFHSGKTSATKIRAESLVLIRSHIRRGPQSAGHVAVALRHDKLPRDNKGRAELSRIEENGVLIAELSTGTIRVCIATDPLGLGNAERYRLRLSTTGTGFSEHAPTEVRDGEAIFEVPAGEDLDRIVASFFDVKNPSHRWDQDGVGFGRGHAPLLASTIIRNELASS